MRQADGNGKNGERILHVSTTVTLTYRRANKSTDAVNTTPSKTPIALTQSLSALRLTHARLLEEHGATKALLRQREAEITAFEQRESEAQYAIEHLHGEVKGLREKVERGERRSTLAEREVGFLQALVVCANIVPMHHQRLYSHSYQRLALRLKSLRKIVSISVPLLFSIP